jgi:hypothetical protein
MTEETLCDYPQTMCIILIKTEETQMEMHAGTAVEGNTL